MRIMALVALPSLVVAVALARNPYLMAQDVPAVAAGSETSRLIVGHPFSAIKYARSVRVLPDGKQQFLRNERYPDRIARDADGRLMMESAESMPSGDLLPDCDRLDTLVPPVCPVWSVFVIDPMAHVITHWNEGERHGPGADDFPLTEARLKQAADLTASVPCLCCLSHSLDLAKNFRRLLRHGIRTKANLPP